MICADTAFEFNGAQLHIDEVFLDEKWQRC